MLFKYSPLLFLLQSYCYKNPCLFNNIRQDRVVARAVDSQPKGLGLSPYVGSLPVGLLEQDALTPNTDLMVKKCVGVRCVHHTDHTIQGAF